ncbi:MAG: hypothetical protein KF700_06560, partial [Hyphomonadaceae bacterium]|nr:hypothetical protein [Hyphomonadaceae bacterium]
MKLVHVAFVCVAVAAFSACGRAPAPPAADVAAERSEAAAAALEAQRAQFAAAPPASTDPASAYQFSFEGLMLPQVPLSAFAGEVVMVVNTASRCGFTPQYEGLQEIYSEYHDRGFSIVGVPA